VGTGLTGSVAVYSATRQSATAFQVAQYNGEIAANLAGSGSSWLAFMTARTALRWECNKTFKFQVFSANTHRLSQRYTLGVTDHGHHGDSISGELRDRLE
jgi:homoserine kinase